MKRLRLYPVLAVVRLHWLRFKRATLNPMAPADQWMQLLQRIDKLERNVK